MTKLVSPGTPVPSIQRIDGCSHSGMIGGYSGGSEQSYFKKVAKVLGARKCGWLSAGGSAACWPTINAGSDGGWSWVLNMFRPPGGPNTVVPANSNYWSNDGTGSYQPHTNVAIVHHGAEDLFYLGSQNLKAYQEAIKTEMSRYCAAFLHEAEADTQLAMYTPTVSAGGTGGTLAAGTWYYKVVAYNAIGESTASQVSIGVAAGQKVTVSWPALQGATGYRVLRSGPNVVSFAGRIEVGNVTTFVDDGTQALVGSTDSPATGANMHWSFGSGITGTIAAGSNWAYSGGGAKYASPVTPGSVNPATMWGQYQTDTDYPGNLVVALGMAIVPGPNGGGYSATYGVTIDGVTQPDIVINHDKGGPSDAENNKVNGIVLRFGRLDCGIPVYNAGGQRIAFNAGVHTIRIALKSVTGTNGISFIFDYAQPEADPLDGPVLVGPSGFWKLASWVGQFPTSAGWTHGSDAAVDPLNDAAVDALIAAQKAALADFPGRSVYVDMDGVINKNVSGTMLNQDNVHPSNHGHSALHDATVKAVLGSGYLTPRLAGAVGRRNLGPFDGGVWRTIGGVYGTGSNMRPLLNTWGPYNTANYPAYMLGTLDGVMRLRGWLKQTGAGSATSTMFQNDTGAAPSAANGPVDCPCTTFNGTAPVVGIMRSETETAATSRGVWAWLNGQTAAGSAMVLNGVEWSMEI